MSETPLRLELMPNALRGMRNRIKELMDERGLTLEEVGERMGVSHTTVKRLRDDEMKLTTEYIDLLSKALDVPPVAIIADVEAIAENDLEAKMLQELRMLSPEDQQAILRSIRRRRATLS